MLHVLLGHCLLLRLLVIEIVDKVVILNRFKSEHVLSRSDTPRHLFLEYKVCLAVKAQDPKIKADPTKLDKNVWMEDSHTKIMARPWAWVQENAATNPAAKELFDIGASEFKKIITEKNMNYLSQSSKGGMSAKKLHGDQVNKLKTGASSSSATGSAPAAAEATADDSEF